MIGTIGKILIDASFLFMLAALVFYFVYSQKNKNSYYRTANWLFGLQGLFIVVASGLLLYLILTHQFNYYYVYNYTSSTLQLKYLISAFWGGQEGSFMLWILYATIIGLVLMKHTKKPYRGPVMFFLALTQLFLLSMLLGFPIGDITIGASPFRTLAEAMPNAPFIQSNPNWLPPDGKGLNDLLKSPWMMIHPPILFLSFSLLTVPCCFALAALWKRKYNAWVKPALPWTLAANLCMLFALFLGGYWAYVTLSFGGFWAWDPVENAALVPLLFGVAGIHTMIIQKKSSTSQKASIVFALFAYLAVVYESFLTRSGILADSSVHSFVSLGLYNQLLLFMAVMALACLGLFIWRYRDMPAQKQESKILSREFMTFAGATVLFLIALVVTIGISSPIIGRFFTENPTPPEISFYNQWTMPLAIIAALLTVIGQYLFWQRQTVESLARKLLAPVALACGATLITIIVVQIFDLYIMLFLLSAWFAFIGNGFVMITLLKKNPKLIGGALSHAGFGIMLLGIISSSFYSSPMLTSPIQAYNRAVDDGEIEDENGRVVQQKATFFELNLKEPKIVNGEFILTWVGYAMEPEKRPGQHRYKILVEPMDNKRNGFYMTPSSYPMNRGGVVEMEFSVDPEVKELIWGDIYLYVAGSSFIERKKKQAEKRKKRTQTVSANIPADSVATKQVKLKKDEQIKLGAFTIRLNNFEQVGQSGLPDSTLVAVRAEVEVHRRSRKKPFTVRPLFAIYVNNGISYSYAPPVHIRAENISLRFKNIDPSTGKVTLQITGIDEDYKEPWVLVIAESKPFISLVWIGTFVLMVGFCISIFRHSGRDKKIIH